MKRVVKSFLVFSLWIVIIMLNGCGNSGSNNTKSSDYNRSVNIPIITSESKYTVEENQIGVMKITVKNKEQKHLIYGISGGKDASSFDINPLTGEIIFRRPPNPDEKSIYHIVIIVYSTGTESEPKEITIKIKRREDKEEEDTTPPKFKSLSSFSIQENQTFVGRIEADDISIVSYSIRGTDANYLFIDSITGIVLFKDAPDYESKKTYRFTVVAIDSLGNQNSQDITVNILDVKESAEDKEEPVFISSNSIDIKENQTDVMTLVATDINKIIYSISGTDASYFNLNSSTGVVTFKLAPDYESGKTSYRFTAKATDSKGNSSIKSIVVNIIDIYEPIVDKTPPTFTSSSSVSVNENQISAIILRATDKNSITYSISGTDASYFNLNSSTGVVTFKLAPDYESGKTSYRFTAKATDSKGNSSTQNIKVTILDVNEVSESDYFITTWKTDNEGESNDNQITIPTIGGGYNYTIDWGDGTIIETGITGTKVHTYDSTGIYSVKISGLFPRFYMNDKHSLSTITTDSLKLLSIEQWGTIKWTSMNKAFCGCKNMKGNATDSPDLSVVTDMSSMFYYAEIFNQDISNWDVSHIINMSELFMFSKKFNQDISNWDVSNVTDMNHMFWSAKVFNKDIGSWDVSNVTDMNSMFWYAKNFNKDISSWNVSSVMDMHQMFGASSFNQNINSWDVSNVTDMNYMFAGNYSFNQPLNSWDVSNVTNMNEMFQGSNFNQPLDSWSVHNVTTMAGMFWGAYQFNQNISNCDISNVTTMELTFYQAKKFNQDISSWNVNNVANMRWMFKNSSEFSNNDLSLWDVSKVTNHTEFSLGWGTGNIEPNWR